MSENYYLFFIPKIVEGKINVDTSDLKKKEVILQLDVPDFTIYEGEIILDNKKLPIILWEHLSLNLIIIIIKSLDVEFENNELDKLLFQIKDMHKIYGIEYIKLFKFKFIDDKFGINEEIDKFNNNFLFSEIEKGNELYQVNYSTFLVRISQHEMKEIIKTNLFTLLSVSNIVIDFERYYFKDSKTNKNEFIKALWAEKNLLLRSPLSIKFPLFSKYNISIIDNLLKYHQKDIIDIQNETLCIQNQTISRQITLLEQIHSVEGGILILTFFIILDVVFTIIFELTHCATLSLISATIVIAIYIIIFYDTLKNLKIKKN